MEVLANKLNVPEGVARQSFAEVFESLGERGAKKYEDYLKKVRSNAQVNARIAELALEAEGAVYDRLLFCGRYSAKAGTPLDDALRSASASVAEAANVRAALGGRKLAIQITASRWGDEHAACRAAAFPYVPACSASHGSPTFDARAAEAVGAWVSPGQLLGYVAMQAGGYIDDISVFPIMHGQGVASSLLAGAAKAERGATLSLDVRAANVPALKLYRSLGFRFGELEHPSFLDWDGGYSGDAAKADVLAKCPPNADLTRIE